MGVQEFMAKKKTWVIWLIAGAAAAIIFKMTLFAPPLLEVVRVEKRDLTAQVYGNGTVEARVVVGISSKGTGRIIELFADQGDQVKTGQLLARLENQDVLQQQQQSAAGVSRSDASLSMEQANLRKAQANLVLAEKNTKRFHALAEKNLISRLEAEQYETAYQLANEEVFRCQAAIKAVRMDQQANRAGLGFARSKVVDTFIHAPHNGIIISRNLEKGATVTAGMSIFTLADPATVWVRANVDESRLKGVAIGKKAIITLRSAPGEKFHGQVARLARQSDRVTEELEVAVAFNEPLKDFRLGEQSDVQIVTEVKKNAPALPSAAIVNRGNARGIWTVSDGKITFLPVTIGIEDPENFTEVLGLDVGVQVVVAAQSELSTLREGMKVRTRR